MDRIESIKKIIAEELGHWNRLHRDEKNQDEKTKLHGACCELLMYEGFPERITTEYLRGQYRMALGRTKNLELKDRELDLVARNRAVKVCAAITKSGKRIKALDKKTE